jgi:hypothetical protein
MDISGNVDAEQRNILMWNRHGKLNQQWDVVYTEDWKGEPGKGELNEEFGLYVERPFYIVSELPSHRYLDLIGNKFAIKTQNGRSSQTWYFHQQSLTIKTKMNNQSWNIENNGRNN